MKYLHRLPAEFVPQVPPHQIALALAWIDLEGEERRHAYRSATPAGGRTGSRTWRAPVARLDRAADAIARLEQADR